jgi:WD40 repeat protein
LVTEQTVNFDNALSAPFYPRQLEPSGRYIVVTTLDEEEASWNLVDREMCDQESGCQLQPIYHLPFWSPDSNQMLMADGNYVYEIFEPVYRTLYRADGNGQNPVAVGSGIAPFWLTSTTYGYSRLNENEEVELVLADSVDDEARVWVNTADLIPLVPVERNWSQLSIWNVWVNPADPEMVVIMATHGGYHSDGPYDFFSIKGTGDSPEIEWLFSHDFPASTGIGPFSPDGRYLLVPQRGTAIHFRDLETGKTIPFNNTFGFFTGWTPNGSYYGQLSDDILTLTSPEDGRQIRVNYDFSTCSGIQWIEP